MVLLLFPRTFLSERWGLDDCGGRCFMAWVPGDPEPWRNDRACIWGTWGWGGYEEFSSSPPLFVCWAFYSCVQFKQPSSVRPLPATSTSVWVPQTLLFKPHHPQQPFGALSRVVSVLGFCGTVTSLRPATALPVFAYFSSTQLRLWHMVGAQNRSRMWITRGGRGTIGPLLQAPLFRLALAKTTTVGPAVICHMGVSRHMAHGRVQPHACYPPPAVVRTETQVLKSCAQGHTATKWWGWDSSGFVGVPKYSYAFYLTGETKSQRDEETCMKPSCKLARDWVMSLRSSRVGESTFCLALWNDYGHPLSFWTLTSFLITSSMVFSLVWRGLKIETWENRYSEISVRAVEWVCPVHLWTCLVPSIVLSDG